MKPILFNTETVQAILEGRKTVTRRPIKLDLGLADTDKNDSSWLKIPDQYGDYHDAKDLCKYKVGDILYVRETWNTNTAFDVGKDFDELPPKENKYIFKADYPDFTGGWKPSIHMPKEAARTFLKVTNVRVERLQDITLDQVHKEGILNVKCDTCKGLGKCKHSGQRTCFSWLWDSTVNKFHYHKYSWEVNPWVWVIEFERIENQ